MILVVELSLKWVVNEPLLGNSDKCSANTSRIKFIAAHDKIEHILLITTWVGRGGEVSGLA